MPVASFLNSNDELCFWQETDGDEQFSLWMWTKEERRSVTKIDFNHDQVSELQQDFPGPDVLCAIQIGSTHFIGTQVS